jgi:hypothetical protein
MTSRGKKGGDAWSSQRPSHHRRLTSSAPRSTYRPVSRRRSTYRVVSRSQWRVEQLLPHIAVLLRLEPILAFSSVASAGRHRQRDSIAKLRRWDQIPVGNDSVVVKDCEREELGSSNVTSLPTAVSRAKIKLGFAASVDCAPLHLHREESTRECRRHVGSDPATRVAVWDRAAPTKSNYSSHILGQRDASKLDVVPAELTFDGRNVVRLRLRLRLVQFGLTKVIVGVEQRRLKFVGVEESEWRKLSGHSVFSAQPVAVSRSLENVSASLRSPASGTEWEPVPEPVPDRLRARGPVPSFKTLLSPSVRSATPRAPVSPEADGLTAALFKPKQEHRP